MLVDAATRANPVERQRIIALLFGGRLVVGAPAGTWPAPSTRRRARAGAECKAAAMKARQQLRRFGISELYTSLQGFPSARIVWDAPLPTEPLAPAPLVNSLLDGNGLRRAAILIANRFSPHTARLLDQDRQRKLTLLLNAFVAELELGLWWLAAEGGHPNPPPFPVRYDVACWYWHPSSDGAIFCLRCGEELRYARSERTPAIASDGEPELTRTARCRACSRGRADD
jgi:hypothetical protein